MIIFNIDYWWNFIITSLRECSSKPCRSFFHIRVPIKLSLKEYKVINDPSEIEKLNNLFPSSEYSSDPYEFIIPSSSLKKVSMNMIVLKIISKIEKEPNYSKEMYRTNNIDVALSTLDDIFKAKEADPLNYLKFTYNINSYSEYTRLINNETLVYNIDEIEWRDIKLSSIWFRSLISRNEHQLIWKLLTNTKTQFTISSVKLYFEYLSEWIEVLLLLSFWPDIKYVELNYKESDVEDESSSISKTISDFTRVASIINTLIIKKR